MRHQVLRNSRAGSEPLVSFLLSSDSKGTRSAWFGLFPSSEVGSVSLTACPGSYLDASGEDVLHVLDFPLYPAFRHFISQLVLGAWGMFISLFSRLAYLGSRKLWNRLDDQRSISWPRSL